MSERSRQYKTEHPDRRPEPESKQTAAIVDVLRRVLDGERVEVFTDEEGRLCWQPVDRGDVERA